jgi:hypothetical protein
MMAISSESTCFSVLVPELSSFFMLWSFQTMGTEEYPLPWQVVQNDDGVDVFETQSGLGYLYYHHPVKEENIRDILVHRGFTKTCQIIGCQGL